MSLLQLIRGFVRRHWRSYVLAGLMLFGSLMYTVALLGMLLVPVVWAADLAAQGVRQSRARGDHTA